MSARRVLIVCGAGYVSGKEIVSLTLAQGLRDLGYDVEFVLSNWHDGAFARRLDRAGFGYSLLRVGFISMTLKWAPVMATLDQLRYWPLLVYRYRELLRRCKPDAVIHTNWQHALLLLPWLEPSRDIFWLHEKAAPNRRFAWLMKSIARRTGRIVCVSDAVARSVRKLGVPKEQVCVIHNGTAPATAAAPPGLQPVLRVGLVGQVGAWKGHDDLIEAMAIVARAGHSVCLRIYGVGEPCYVQALKRKIAALNLTDRVEWLGFVDDQDAIYAGIDLCAMPSRFDEPFGLSAIEAAMRGRPVVCSARGGLIEIVEDGVTGLIVEAERPDRLAAAIVSLAADRGRLRDLGEAARERALSKFSSASLAGRFADMLPLPKSCGGRLP